MKDPTESPSGYKPKGSAVASNEFDLYATAWWNGFYWLVPLGLRQNFTSPKGERFQPSPQGTLIRETWKNYSFMIPLNRDAVLSGAVSAAVLLVVIELVVLVLSRLFRSARRRSRSRVRL